MASRSPGCETSEQSAGLNLEPMRSGASSGRFSPWQAFAAATGAEQATKRRATRRMSAEQPSFGTRVELGSHGAEADAVVALADFAALD